MKFTADLRSLTELTDLWKPTTKGVTEWDRHIVYLTTEFLLTNQEPDLAPVTNERPGSKSGCGTLTANSDWQQRNPLPLTDHPFGDNRMLAPHWSMSRQNALLLADTDTTTQTKITPWRPIEVNREMGYSLQIRAHIKHWLKNSVLKMNNQCFLKEAWIVCIF